MDPLVDGRVNAILAVNDMFRLVKLFRAAVSFAPDSRVCMSERINMTPDSSSQNALPYCPANLQLPRRAA